MTAPSHSTASSQLVLAASRGDVGALDELMNRHLPALHAFVRLHAGPLLERRVGFSDLVQSTCREVLNDMSHFGDRSEGDFRNWLFKAAMRKIQDKLRYHRAQRRDALREVQLSSSSAALSPGGTQLMRLYQDSLTPSRVAMIREDLEAFELAFADLPEDQRKVFILRRIVGLEYSAIATETGKSEPAARKLYSRASARLLTLLAGS